MFCECNCHVEHDKSTSEEATRLEEIMRDRMLKEASPVLLQFLDKALSKGLDYHNRRGDNAA
jgi:hypothetical protein